MRENRACLFFFFFLIDKQMETIREEENGNVKTKKSVASLSQNFARLPQDSIQ